MIVSLDDFYINLGDRVPVICVEMCDVPRDKSKLISTIQLKESEGTST